MDENLQQRTKLSVEDIVELLSFCLNATEFAFNEQFFLQTFGCAMGSPVSALVANMVMEDVEERILSTPVFGVLQWKRYVDDTWVVLPKIKVEEFLVYINKIEPSIEFTMEREDSDKKLAFLDVEVERKADGTTNHKVYRKKMHTDKYLDFSSYHPPAHKRSVVRSLQDRATTHCSSLEETNEENKRVQDTLIGNGYPQEWISRRRQHNEKPEWKKTVSLPYVQGVTDRVARVLKSLKVNVFFRAPAKLSSILRIPKDRPPEDMKKGVIYKLECKDCDKCYVGQTGNALSTRIQQHRAAFRLYQPDKSAIAQHSITEGHRIDWDNPTTLAQQSRYKERLFLEGHHIRTNNCVNKTDPIHACYNDVIFS